MSANQATFPVATMARVLGVSEAGYYAGGAALRLPTRWPMRRCSRGCGPSTPDHAKRIGRRACIRSCKPLGISMAASGLPA